MTNKKRHMDRRTFIKATTLGGASLALTTGMAGNTLAADTGKSKGSKKIPTRALGNTGISLPILALGGIDWLTNQSLLRMAFKMGLTHWDAAPIYENGKCEQGIGKYFGKYPEERKDVFLVTKASRTTEPKAMSAMLDQSLERMQTDYIDLYFIHALADPKVLSPEIKAWAEQKKKEGKIKRFGISTHSNMAEMMTASAKCGYIDAIMTTYNFQVMEDDAVKKGMDALAKAGVGFIAMKTQGQSFGFGSPPSTMIREGSPPGEGTPGRGMSQGPPPGMGRGSEEPEDLSAIQHFMDKGYTLEQAKLKRVWEDERVTAILSQITNLGILKENVAVATDGKALSALDRDVLTRLAANTCDFYCQACMRCETVLGADTRVPDVLRYMMYYNSYGKKYEARRLFQRMPERVRGKLAVSDFSRAEQACPNRIQIGSVVKEAVRLLG